MITVDLELVRRALIETLEKFGCDAPPSVTAALSRLTDTVKDDVSVCDSALHGDSQS